MPRNNKYALSNMQLFWACWDREKTLVKRNAFLYGFRFFVTVLMVISAPIRSLYHTVGQTLSCAMDF